ncbi:SDR family NAD(P)-dependent oxidoreductase [Nonomuraea sp. CA-141351]|uniref:SDR family NAD(P)-dependent oxidoreductase n=1 Tax=Nonomuraea sp. CA-141351 TaxID=3239996 RepID=UPI003D8F395C
MSIMRHLQRRVALVTGGGGEIGAAIDAYLVAMGAAVVVNHRDQTDRAAAEVTAEAVAAADGKSLMIAADIADPAAVHRLIDTAWPSSDGWTSSSTTREWGSSIPAAATGCRGPHEGQRRLPQDGGDEVTWLGSPPHTRTGTMPGPESSRDLCRRFYGLRTFNKRTSTPLKRSST